MKDLIKTLRQRSGVGILECQKALKASDGDLEKAFEALRKSGQAKAAKKAAHAVGQGIVAVKISQEHPLGALIELNCQTDFVARNSVFLDFADQLLTLILGLEADKVAVDTLLTQALNKGADTVASAREALVLKTGENVQISRIAQIQAKGTLYSYTHDHRIAVLVDLQGGDEALGKDIAMHIAASRPIVIEPADIPKPLLEKEREIYKAQMADSGKPEQVVEKNIAGKLQKFSNDTCLLGQPFIKEPSQTVGALLKSGQASVHQFIRYEMGEANS